MRALGSLVVLSAALLGGASPARAFARFDFDQRYFIEPGYIVKDHTLVEADDGTLHLFYIRADESVPESQRAKALGHATTTDLRHWQFHPDVIPVVRATWEESFVWAPHIIKVGSVWFMYYTGVNRYYAKAIVLAVSTDLFDWTKDPGNPASAQVGNERTLRIGKPKSMGLAMPHRERRTGDIDQFDCFSRSRHPDRDPHTREAVT